MRFFYRIKRLFNNGAYDPVFIPSTNGPHSNVVEDTITALENNHLIHREITDNDISFAITDDGRKMITNQSIDLTSLVYLKRMKAEWDKWDSRQLSSYIFLNYPEFLAKTELRCLLDT